MIVNERSRDVIIQSLPLGITDGCTIFHSSCQDIAIKYISIEL